MHLLLWPDKRHVPRGGCSKDKATNGLSNKRKAGAHFSCVKRPESTVPKEGGAVIITGRLWGNSSRKTVEEYRPWT